MMHALIATTLIGIAGQPGALGSPEPELPAETATTNFETVGDLLDAIEASDADIHTLRAQIQHITVNTLADDRQLRSGELAVKTDRPEDGPPDRAFAIRFTRFAANDALRDIDRRYIFDGTWLAEIDVDERVFSKYRIVPPGEHLDALEDPSSAPFWLPLDRERERIERIAESELVAPTDWVDGEEMPEKLRAFVSLTDAVQLHLKPRVGTGYAERWDDVRLWFDRETLLPVMYVAVDHSGDQQITQLFIDPEKDINAPLPELTFSTATPDAAAGWDVQIQDYRGVAP